MANKKITVGIWEDEHKMVEAARKTREAGFKNFDAITPYPVHGIEEAMGIKRSWIPYICFSFGLLGCTFALWLTNYVAEVDWPINIGGKPLNLWAASPGFIPIVFEMTVLFAALSSVAALLFVACDLPKVNPPIIDPTLTSHNFAIFVDAEDSAYNTAKIQQQFKEWGAKETRETEF